jgi:hypothetical protein
MPYLAVATGFVHNFCEPDAVFCDFRFTTPVVIDIETAAAILDEDITWWNDTRIASHNPEKRLPNERIRIVAGPKFSTYHLSFVQRVRDSYLPGFAYRGGDDMERETFLEAWMDVSLTAYSFSFVVFNGTIVEGVERLSLVNAQGVAVAAKPETIEACAQDTYDEETHLFHLQNSKAADCYPLCTTYNVFVKNPLLLSFAAQMVNFLYEKSLRPEKSSQTALFVSEFGTLTDLIVPGHDLREENFRRLEGITLSSTGASIIRIPHELNLIPITALIGMYFVMGYVVLALKRRLHAIKITS